ncbi:MAG: OmpH family outer membrane protein [Verrucomicrobiota bacterium]
MTIRSIYLAAIAATSLSFAAPAMAQGTEMKVGIVDMKRVFQEYWKTKDAEKKVNEDKSKAKKELDERGTKYKDLIGRWNEIEKVLKDKLVNEQMKAQKQKEAQDVISEARALERDMEEFKRRREQQLQEQVMRMRKGLLEAIKGSVEEKAKRDNYDLVFDKSGMSPSGVPFLLHSKDAVDFSTEVIAELNKNAPPESLAADPAPAPAPDAKKAK